MLVEYFSGHLPALLVPRRTRRSAVMPHTFVRAGH
ncbi:hypothetical protein DSM3645_02793 [Blastopirellula marina DSM 3645]|uniref:Uncharacterized protein n=1 Tax=Blastopirellula marina DSM 3645 TaxID=314230 RepID=A3ZVM2_9BACT|nr:hypothetical protein DSM3645_02793 [Blastopirellula marina DSM 3645]